MVSLEQVKITRNRNFLQYKKFVNSNKFSQILNLAKKLTGIKITVVSATPYGGGVAEIWNSAIQIFQSLGIDIAWYTISAPIEFFQVTKKFHNLLQGSLGKLTEAERNLYLKVNKKLATELTKIPTDILLVHDPQPAAIIEFLPNQKPVSVWRCHIDTSNTNRSAWMFLKQLISLYDHLIFTLPQYAHNEVLENRKISFFQPTIDPIDTKLKKIKKNQAWKILGKFGLDKKRSLILAPSRFDPFKDQLGVLEAYLLVKKHIPYSQLLFTGPVAFDDPEAGKIRRKLLKKIKKNPGILLGKDIFVYTNQDSLSYSELAAAYQVCAVVIQKSLAEGFGLTVAEAGFHSKPVIGGAVGGIAYQIIDYNQNPAKATGILVDVTQPDRGVSDTAFWCEFLLKDKKLAKILGQRAKRRVIKNFLHPQAIFNYLNLFNKILFEKEMKKAPRIFQSTQRSV